MAVKVVDGENQRPLFRTMLKVVEGENHQPLFRTTLQVVERENHYFGQNSGQLKVVNSKECTP